MDTLQQKIFAAGHLKRASAKGCFINVPSQCLESPIKAHSISESKYLSVIAKDGKMLMPGHYNGRVVFEEQGKKKASTFPGFCGPHDTIFNPIDIDDHVPGNKKHEFLFAMRAAAREYWAKTTQSKGMEELMRLRTSSEERIKLLGKDMPIDAPDSIDLLMQQSIIKGQRDTEEIRKFFNENYAKGNYGAIHTVTIELPKFYPVVASSMFNIELDFEGNIVNDLENLTTRMRTSFFSIVPQEDKTFILLSCRKSDAKFLKFLEAIDNMPDKGVVASNILCVHTENVCMNLDYFYSLDIETRKLFYDLWGHSAMPNPRTRLVEDPRLNIFV
ncbi:MAG TPA: hypothetical protein VD735_03520 [Candidatus Saccharimonadales bacterium]|nr:hypothetical protein [Candidatus Saccharimonadales bacterium]